MRTRTTISAIDLFCGTGGLSLGLQQGGVRVVAGIDNAASCKYPYTHNIKAKFIKRSVCDVKKTDLEALWGKSKTRLLAGCALANPSPHKEGEWIRQMRNLGLYSWNSVVW